ncbi:hypothetical protein [Sphingobium chungangianum]
MCKPLLALVALLLIPSELEAKDEAKPSLQFTVLEDDYQWNNDIEKARTTLAREIPPGTSFWSALDVLEEAGAHCTGDRQDPRSRVVSIPTG